MPLSETVISGRSILANSGRSNEIVVDDEHEPFVGNTSIHIWPQNVTKQSMCTLFQGVSGQGHGLRGTFGGVYKNLSIDWPSLQP